MGIKSYFFSLILGSLSTVLTANISHAVSLSVSSSSISVLPGDSVSAEIAVSGLGDMTSPSLSAYDLNLGFNSSLLTFDGITYGDPLLGNQLELGGLESIKGSPLVQGNTVRDIFEISLDFSSELVNFQISDFILATLVFDVISDGNASFSLDIITLVDENNNSLVSVPEPSSRGIVFFLFAFYFVTAHRNKKTLLKNTISNINPRMKE